MRVRCLNDRVVQGGGQEASMYLPLHCRRESKEAVDILRLLPYYSLVTQPTRKYKWTVTGHAWGRLSRPVDVCVGRFPAVCAKPVRQDSHADLSIAMTKHRADQAHGGIEYWPIDSGTEQRLDLQTMSDNSSTAVGPSASVVLCRSSPTTWILLCSHVERGV